MAKLQKTVRANGSVVFSLNIPQEIMEQMGWEKGLELEIVKNFDRLVIFAQEGEDVPKIRNIPGQRKDVEILPKDSSGEDSSNQHSLQDQGISPESGEGSEGNNPGNNPEENSGGGEI